MAVNFITDSRDIDVGLFSEMAEGTRSYFERGFTELEQRFGDLKALRVARERHEYYQGDAARARRRRINNENNVLDETRIHHLSSLEDFRNANPTMVDYLMCNPTIRRRARAQTIEGYSESWVDTSNTQYLESDALYGSVVSGVWGVDAEGNDYMEDYNLDPSEQRQLLLSEVLDIQYSWADCMRHLNDSDEDPTSPSGGKLS